MNRRAAVGFDRRVDLEWLDATAGQVAAGADEGTVRAFLWRMLDGVVAGVESRSARGKTVTVLTHVWSTVTEAARPLRDLALARLPAVPPEERLAVHWAMMLATYPFAADVATVVGRLTALQDDFTLAQLSRRIGGRWGERTTVRRAVRRVVRSMVQWGALRDTATRGAYQPAACPLPVGPDTAFLLIEAVLLHVEADGLSVPQVTGHPALFPFRIEVSAAHLRRMPQFLVQRQDLGVDVVSLAR